MTGNIWGLSRRSKYCIRANDHISGKAFGYTRRVRVKEKQEKEKGRRHQGLFFFFFWQVLVHRGFKNMAIEEMNKCLPSGMRQGVIRRSSIRKRKIPLRVSSIYIYYLMNPSLHMGSCQSRDISEQVFILI